MLFFSNDPGLDVGSFGFGMPVTFTSGIFSWILLLVRLSVRIQCAGSCMDHNSMLKLRWVSIFLPDGIWSWKQAKGSHKFFIYVKLWNKWCNSKCPGIWIQLNGVWTSSVLPSPLNVIVGKYKLLYFITYHMSPDKLHTLLLEDRM